MNCTAPTKKTIRRSETGLGMREGRRVARSRSRGYGRLGVDAGHERGLRGEAGGGERTTGRGQRTGRLQPQHPDGVAPLAARRVRRDNGDPLWYL